MIKFNKEQIFIVTGASSGLGEGTALLLNELGATVIGIARNKERLDAMKAKCKYPENMHLEIKDLTEDIEGLPQYVKELKNKYGKFSGMAYCAGISALCPAKIIEYTFATNVLNINYLAPLFMTKGIIDKRNNVGKGCSLVFMSSIDALISTKGQCLYAGSKAALQASMKTISKEVASQGVRINTLSPSMIKTPMTDLTDLNIVDSTGNLYPWGWGEVSDVANMIAYLLSDQAKFISGQNYIIDSGFVGGQL